MSKLIRWLLRKTLFSVIVGSMALAAYALFLFDRDPIDYQANRARRVADLTAEQKQLQADLAAKDAELKKVRDAIHEHRDRETRAQHLIDDLKSQQSRWQRWFGDARQQDEIDARLARVQALDAQTRQEILDLQRDATRKDWQRDGVVIDLERVETELKSTVHAQSTALHYTSLAWRRAWPYFLAGVACYFFGAVFWRIFLYFVVAPAFARGRALQFSQGSPRFPQVAKGAAEVEVPIWPGEILRVRPGFLRTTDLGLMQRRRLLFDWRLPLTSCFSGLRWLHELRHGRARGEQRVTLAAPGEGGAEFSLVHIPEGTSLIVRPRFVAATVQPADQRSRMRSRWRLLHRNAWAAGQWRFIEVFGPGRVVLFGPAPARIEVLNTEENGAQATRRLRGRAIVGFSPDVQYGRVRTDSFWAYLRGGRKLLDALLTGPGLLVCHETPRHHGRLARAWGGLMHAFGL